MLTVAAIVAAVLLALAAWRDIATRTIPDGIAVALALLGVAVRAAEGVSALGLSVVTALVLFLLLLPLAMFGLMGGGDLKLAAALALGLPPLGSYQLVVATALAGGALALLYMILIRLARARDAAAAAAPREAVPRRPPPLRASRRDPLLRRVLAAEIWRLRRGGPLPYGVAIAAGGALVLFRSTGV